MTLVRFRGDAPAVAQVDTIEVDGYDGATTYILTIGGKTVSVVGDTDAETTAVALAAAWNASEIVEFARVTANAFSGTTPLDTITLTADTAGMPFVVSESTSGGGGSMVQVNVTVSSGPNHADTVANWEPSGLPGDEDDVLFSGTSTSCLYGLDTSDWPAGPPLWNSLTIKASYTGRIGLPEFASSGDYEYREDFFVIAFHTTGDEYISIGEGSGVGSGRIKLSVANMTTNMRIDVHSTGSRSDTTKPPVLLGTGTQSASTTLSVNSGDVGVAVLFDGFAVIDVINVESSSANVEIGAVDVTLTTINLTAGTVTTLSNVTTVTMTAGTFVLAGSAAIGTLYVRGGICYYDSDGATTTLIVVTNGAVLNFTRDARPVTIAQLDLYEGATVYDTGQRTTLTNGFDTIHCGISDVTVNFGDHLTWVHSAI